jgi:hypothetical protein
MIVPALDGGNETAAMENAINRRPISSFFLALDMFFTFVFLCMCGFIFKHCES